MNLRALIEGHPEVLGGLVVDRRGQIAERPVGSGAPREEEAAATAKAVSELAAAGATLGLRGLGLLQVKREGRALLVVVREEALLLAAVDPGRTGPAEKLLERWRPAPAPSRPTPPPIPPSAATPSPARPAPDDAWARLRRALSRGQLTSLNLGPGDLEKASAAARGAPGSEALPGPERERGLQELLDGVGAVLAGDGWTGARLLLGLAAAGQKNLTFRWLALLWTVRAAFKSGAFAEASAAGKEALAVARLLDDDARAVTELTLGELLAHGRDASRAQPWLAEAEASFERLGDGLGRAEARLAQARVLALLGREAEATALVQKVGGEEPRWDEPALFLARRALLAGDAPSAEELVQPFQTHAADRLRVVIDAVRQGSLVPADAGEYLREQEAPASGRSLKALERIVRAAPRFVQARVALAWALMNVGHHAEAASLLRDLATRELGAADRFAVMLGLDRIGFAERAGLVHGEPAPSPGIPTPVPAELASPPAPSSGAASAILGGPPGGTGKMFSGELSDFALPDLLEFLRNGRRTGLLVFTSSQGVGALRFADGRVTSASSPATPTIGRLLVESQQLSAEALDAAASALGPGAADHLLSDHLRREGLVANAALEGALERQLGVTLHELLRWKDGEFTFDREGETGAARLDHPVSVDVQGTMMRVFQEIDETTRDHLVPAGGR